MLFLCSFSGTQRRFFETEAVVILAVLLSRYKIDIKEEPQFAGETFEEKKTRILTAKEVLTLTYVSSQCLFAWH